MPAAKDFDGEILYAHGDHAGSGLKDGVAYKATVVTAGTGYVVMRNQTGKPDRILLSIKEFEKLLKADKLVLDVQHELGKPESVQCATRRLLSEKVTAPKYDGEEPGFTIKFYSKREDLKGHRNYPVMGWWVAFKDPDVDASAYETLADDVLDEFYGEGGYYEKAESGSDDEVSLLYGWFHSSYPGAAKRAVSVVLPRLAAELVKLGFSYKGLDNEYERTLERSRQALK